MREILCRTCVVLMLTVSPIACAHSADSPSSAVSQPATAHPIKVAETKAVLRDLSARPYFVHSKCRRGDHGQECPRREPWLRRA